jgi:hypothetical protein
MFDNKKAYQVIRKKKKRAFILHVGYGGRARKPWELKVWHGICSLKAHFGTK